MEAIKQVEVLQARLHDVIVRLQSEMQADTVTMVCYDHGTQRFYLPLSAGLFDPASFARVMPSPDRLTGKIAREKRKIIANSVRGHPEIDGPFARREKIFSAAGLPILNDGRAVGVAFVSYRRPYQFSDHDIKIIEGFGQEAATHIVAANGVSALKENTYHLQSEEQQVLQGVAQTIYTAMNGMPVAIWLRDRDPKHVSIHAALGVVVDYQEKAVAHLDDDSIISYVMRTGESLSIKQVCYDPRFKYRVWAMKAGWESLLIVPLKIKNHIIGAIEVFSLDPREFSRTDTDKISNMLGRIGLAIENYRRVQELKLFSQIVQTLGTVLETEKALQEIVDGARSLAKADTANIFFFTRGREGENFRLASQSPKSSDLFLHTPRPIGGLSRYIIDTGKSVNIADVLDDGRVHQEVIAVGTRSMIGVPIQVGLEKAAVLYVRSNQSHAFGEHDVDLLRDLAGHAAAALQRVRLLDAFKQIEQAGSRIFDVDNVTQDVLRETCRLGFEFGAVQLIDRATDTIATVQGIGIAQGWIGLAKHRLDGEAKDIQADIVQSLAIEVISGWDNRFDQWIYRQFNHQRLIRVFAPILLWRDEKGELYPPALDCYDWDHFEKINSKDGAVLRIKPTPKLAVREKGYLEVIGTIEAGYQIAQRNYISVEDAQALFRLICEKARLLWETQLNHVLEAIVKNAMQLISADSASIRLLYNPNKDRYAFLACAGKIGPEYMEHFHPRKDGLGNQALRDHEPKVSDDNFENEYPEYFHLTELKKQYPQRYKLDEGMRAFACFPLIVSETQYGLLFLHFWREHRFSNEELEWGKLFAEQAVTALKNTLVFQAERQAARALDSLHFVGQFLVSQPQVELKELLQRIAQNALNVLNADVITVYLYDQQQDVFPLLPPIMEGQLLAEMRMMTKIERNDVPSRIIRDIRQNIYAPDAAQHPILCDRTRMRPPGKEDPYVDRERIKSAAGILLQVGSGSVGIMFVNYRTRHEFAPEEKRLIETFASAAAIGIYNARLFNTTDEQLHERLNELTTRVNELRQLQEVSAAITYSTTDVKGVLKQIAKGARSVLDADVALILPYDEKDKTFNTQLVEYDGVSHGLEFNPVRPGGITASVLENAEGYVVVDDIDHPPARLDAKTIKSVLGKIRVKSFLGVALRVGAGFVTESSGDKETVGVLYIDFLRPHKFKKEEIQVAQMFANYAATAIAAARVHERKLQIERVAAINTFGASFAHRVGNLLGTVPVNFNAIERLLKESHDATLKAHIDLLHADVQKIQHLLEAGKNLRRFGSTDKEPVIINEVLKEVLNKQKPPANIGLSVEFDPTVPPIPANRPVMIDIFSDMIENAMDAMPQGGRLAIVTKVRHDQNLLEIRVSDTGCGIAPEVLKRLREPFFTTKEDNMGLGVWLCDQAVQQMRGKLIIESQVHVGTSFIMQLPI